MKRRLVTSALPYVNNIPHLGNLIQVLSADVFARFCRLRGYETLYICGTDEHGTATEARAREEGITPREVCTRYYKIHDDIYRWFNISFDRFGRTSTEKHTEITQHIFWKLYENGYIKEREIEQLYSEESDMWLADRYVRGTCPYCGYEEARGDQCEDCGTLLDPSELIEPRSAIDNSRPVMRKSKHLYIDLPAILPHLQSWMEVASKKGKWSHNAIQMTQSWIRDGLKERGITRDLKWGIQVPLEGYEDKVFYVWFDAPIGYISITANHTDDWESWWRNPDEVELFQFIGKDNIPFHTVIFPSSLIGTGETWTMLHTMSSTEYLNYEGGQFSKSRGIGVFGTDAQDTGIPADVWRFYIFYNRPETSDFTFTWDDFQEKTNGELIGNLSNLVNRTLTFLHKYFDATVPESDTEGTVTDTTWKEFWEQVRKTEDEIGAHMENAELRAAFHKVFSLSSYGNKTFQQGEPWKTRKSDPDAAKALLFNLVYLVRDLAVLIHPFIPETAERIAGLLGGVKLHWSKLGQLSGIRHIEKPAILFDQLTDEQVAELRERFSGSQAERQDRQDRARAAKSRPVEERFAETVDLRTAKILSVERHPKADKLYVETVDDGRTRERQIVSGLVPFYAAEELEGRTVVLVDNLKPAKLRGVKSHGMLLAAEDKDEEGNERVEVLFADHAEPGTAVRPALGGSTASGDAGKATAASESGGAERGEITVEDFFATPLSVKDGTVYIGDAPLECDGRPLTTSQITNGSVG
jgi:methionyl-tRNA synthetase